MSLRASTWALTGLILILSLTACNAEEAIAPGAFRATDVGGVWKLRARSESCAPEEMRFEFDVTNQNNEPGYLTLTGNWFVVADPPDTQTLTGRVQRETAEVEFELDQNIVMSGVFLSNDEVALGYQDARTGCAGRHRGLKVE